MNVPEKHRELAHAWVDGAKVQNRRSYGSEKWLDVAAEAKVRWSQGFDYRIKPTKIKRWQWLVKTPDGPVVTACWLSEIEAKAQHCEDIIRKIEETMREDEA